MSLRHWLALLIIIWTLIGVALGSYPWLRMNRATIALVAVQAINLEDAYKAFDLNTLVLLFAMMIINANLRLAGFFWPVGGWVIQRARTPRLLLALIILASGLLSALFVNDTVVLMFKPLVLEIVLALRRTL